MSQESLQVKPKFDLTAIEEEIKISESMSDLQFGQSSKPKLDFDKMLSEISSMGDSSMEIDASGLEFQPS